MQYAVLLDFGSTYTKVVCVDLQSKRTVLTGKVPSTVSTDAGICLHQCFDMVKEEIGEDAFLHARKLSTSSAAGGLRIAVSGLTRSLSIDAGRNASFGAGGKVVYTAYGLVSEDDILQMEANHAEIILLCGGYEGGNSELVLKNAEILSRSRLTVPVIFAGNSLVARDARMLFTSRGKECFIADNLIPEVGRLHIEPVVNIIRNLFMDRITDMKGIGSVRKYLDGPIIPTPAAVLSAGELLAFGTAKSEGIGPYLMADIGGATTDIYSFSENICYEGSQIVGASQPRAKRTVEGDMGMRESSICAVQEIGPSKFAKNCGITEQRLTQAMEYRVRNREYLADTAEERRIDLQLACSVLGISARRHAGKVTKEFHGGARLIQRGKNLTEITTVIGTGGILVNNPRNAAEILKSVCTSERERGQVLLPEKVNTMIDCDYVFYAAGLLRAYDEETALAIMKDSIQKK